MILLVPRFALNPRFRFSFGLFFFSNYVALVSLVIVKYARVHLAFGSGWLAESTPAGSSFSSANQSAFGLTGLIAIFVPYAFLYPKAA